MKLRQTHTYVELELSSAAYNEIAFALRAAGYDHCFMEDGAIDMLGLAVTMAPLPPKATTAIVTRTPKDADKLLRAVRAACANLDVHSITGTMLGRRYERVIVTFRVEDPYPLPAEEQRKADKSRVRESCERLALDNLTLLLPPGKRTGYMPLDDVYAALSELGA